MCPQTDELPNHIMKTQCLWIKYAKANLYRQDYYMGPPIKGCCNEPSKECCCNKAPTDVSATGPLRAHLVTKHSQGTDDAVMRRKAHGDRILARSNIPTPHIGRPIGPPQPGQPQPG